MIGNVLGSAWSASTLILFHFGCFPEMGESLSNAFLESDLRLPVEQLPRQGDVGLSNLGIIRWQPLKNDLARRARDRNNRLGKLEDGHLLRVAEIDRGEVDLIPGEEVFDKIRRKYAT